MDCKFKPNIIITTLVIISITVIISSEPAGRGYGFQPFSITTKRSEHGPQHIVLPILSNNHHNDKHKHIVKDAYYQKQSPETVTTKKPVVIATTKTPEVTTTTTPSKKPQGLELSVTTKEPPSRWMQVKAYHAYQNLKTTTTTKPKVVETTTPYVRQSATAPTTTSSPMKLTTKQIPEVRHEKQEVNSATEKTQGESKNGKEAQPIAGVTKAPKVISKSPTTKLQDQMDDKTKKKHRHRHHHSSRHGHSRHHNIKEEDGLHSHRRHGAQNQHRVRGTGHHHRGFHSINSGRSDNTYKRPQHQSHYESGHGRLSDSYHGRRVKRENTAHVQHKRSEADDPYLAASGESSSMEGNEIDEMESGSYSASVEEGRSTRDSNAVNVLDIAPGPYLMHHSDEDISGETGRSAGTAKDPTFDDWTEFVTNQRSTLLADPDDKKVYKPRGYVPVMQPDEHFKYIDKQYKDKNERTIVFHNLHDFLKQQRMKFRIPELPPPKVGAGSRIFVDLMSDME